jgi:hypothetical protein
MVRSLCYPDASILLFKVKMGGGKRRVVGFGMVILLFVWAEDFALICIYVRPFTNYCYHDMFGLLVLQQINCNGPSNLILTIPSALDQAYTTQSGHITTYKFFYIKGQFRS